MKMNSGTLLHEVGDCFSYLCYLKNWGESPQQITEEYKTQNYCTTPSWGIPKPSAIWIDEEEGVHLMWHDIADVFYREGRLGSSLPIR